MEFSWESLELSGSLWDRPRVGQEEVGFGFDREVTAQVEGA